MSETTWTQDAGMSSPTEADNVENYSAQAEAAKDAAATSATAAATSATSASGSASTASTKAAEAAASATASASSATQSASSATSAASSATTAGSAQTAAETAKTGAETAQTAAETAKAAAETAQTAAETAETNAETAETNASTSATAAATSATAASGSATSASTQATNAATSATASETSKVAAVAAQTAAETAQAAAELAENNAEIREVNATTSALNAATYAINAATSETAAATSETNAATSETNAASSETAASNSATAASGSASTAASEATAAAGSATAASASASSASAAQTAAETAETNAETAETNAETAQTAAETAETNAATSATTATTQATTATTKAGEASASATAAAASEAAASSSETSAASSATTATTQATNASTSATASETSRVAAVAAQTAAETAETNAETAQTAAETAETNAAASETAAATSETNAATSASTATTQAGISTTKAGEASASATSAAASATSASASKDAALAALDSFDDRYLGQKSADPTVDNDGDALVAGALYFNTTTDSMMVYEGSAWVAAYASLSGALLAASNLSDVADAAAARTNLGLVIGTNVQAFSAVLAATTASYTTAEETKLAGIEANATADQTASQIKTAYESNANTNEFSDAEQTKLAGIEAGATADQTAAQIKTAYESNADTNEFSDAEQTKLAGIEAGAKDDQTITAGSGLSGGGTGDVTLSHADTSSVSSSDNSGNTFIQDLTFDTYGHVTAVGTGSVSVGNGTLTVQGTGALGGSGTFTANQSSNATISISHDDTSSQVSVDNSGATVIQDVTLDGYGHVTALGSHTLTLANLGYTGATDANNYSFPYTVSASASNSTVVQRNSSGYIYANYFNTSPNDIATGSITKIVAESGDDGFMRHASADAVRSFINVANGANNYSLPATPSVTGINIGSQVNLAESADRADLLQITSSTSGWAGLQIRNSSNEGRWSFMTDGASAGLYDDENGDWALQMSENGGVTLYHNGVANFTTGATYMEMARNLDMNNYDIYGVDQLFHHGDTNTYMQFHAADQWRVVVGGSERLEVKNSSPHVLVTGDLNSTSDERLKDNIEPIENALSDVCKLEGVSFNWKDTGTKATGFIAQQVEPIFPDLVSTSEDDGIKSVNYIGLIGHLVEAIKEQQAQIDALTAKLNG